MITPPVALASYAAAGIAKADPKKTGWFAFKLGLPSVPDPVRVRARPGLLFSVTAAGSRSRP